MPRRPKSTLLFLYLQAWGLFVALGFAKWLANIPNDFAIFLAITITFGWLILAVRYLKTLIAAETETKNDTSEKDK